MSAGVEVLCEEVGSKSAVPEEKSWADFMLRKLWPLSVGQSSAQQGGQQPQGQDPDPRP